MARPDVALVSPYPVGGALHTGRSGVASYTANLARALAGAGAAVHVVAPGEEGRRVTRDGAVVVERCFRPGRAAGPAAVRTARATGAPAVHVQFELFLYGGATALPGLLAALTVGRRGSRTVVTMHQVVDPAWVDTAFVRMHGIAVPPPLARAALAGLQRALPRVADVTVVHEAAFAALVPGAVVIPHGIERADRADRADSFARLGLDDGRLVALCFGFIAPYKGLELACAAAELAGERVQVVVAGGEHPRHRGGHSYAQRLRERYGHCVRFVGHVPEREIAHWYAAADIALLSYPRPHASSGALALALAHGTPVLLSRALANCIDAPDRLAVDACPDALARRLGQLAADPAALAELGADTAGLGEGRSWAEVARRHLALYEEVAAAHAAGRRLPGV